MILALYFKHIFLSELNEYGHVCDSGQLPKHKK